MISSSAGHDLPCGRLNSARSAGEGCHACSKLWKYLYPSSHSPSPCGLAFVVGRRTEHGGCSSWKRDCCCACSDAGTLSWTTWCLLDLLAVRYREYVLEG